MKVLCINAGSSTVKFQMFEMPEEKVLVSANFEKIGDKTSFYSIKFNGEKTKKEIYLENHESAVKIFLEELINFNVIKSLDDIEAIGHRVVQGGSKYDKSILIDDAVIKDIEDFVPLAPLHNPGNLMGIRVAKKMLPKLQNIAVFDTAFHQSMEEEQYIYPVPYEWYEDHKVRRYGFHGTSHKYLYNSMQKLLNKNDIKVITCHLGSGSSITAIDNNKVVATSMGFTPLGGITMGTRCGDIDPSIIAYMMRETGKSIDEVTNELNKKSGFLGMSGVGADSRDIEDGIIAGNKRCRLAQDIFVNRIIAFIGHYYLLLNKPDVIVFSAGIGENSPLTRKEIVDKLSSLNIYLDETANNVRGKLTKISRDDSEVLCYVVPTDEEVMIARDTYKLIS